MSWQVRHSKVRSSKPRLPGEIRANPILCSQVRHSGRSTIEDELRITQHPETVCVSAQVGLSGVRHSDKILAQALKRRGTASRSKPASNRVSEAQFGKWGDSVSSWSEREDLNLRPLVSQTSALTGLRHAPMPFP